ncbi:MAG: hypothetical protein ABI793_15100 [Flavobacterium sp.]
MIKKITRILFAVFFVLFLMSCKNTKQKLQEYVTNYNIEATSFKSENVTLTTARGYLNDNKIELRFETNLENNESNKKTAEDNFPVLLKGMITKGQISKELIEEGVAFHVYFLANDNTVLAKQIIKKEEMDLLLKK